ncbi:MAG: hypothetical protein LBP52_05575 [Burkholderiaceae bacterium]|jgi:hypothetical protein|nr:hypothetical protein [Burkholderiaceae bacterium]
MRAIKYAVIFICIFLSSCNFDKNKIVVLEKKISACLNNKGSIIFWGDLSLRNDGESAYYFDAVALIVDGDFWGNFLVVFPTDNLLILFNDEPYYDSSLSMITIMNSPFYHAIEPVGSSSVSVFMGSFNYHGEVGKFDFKYTSRNGYIQFSDSITVDKIKSCKEVRPEYKPGMMIQEL